MYTRIYVHKYALCIYYKYYGRLLSLSAGLLLTPIGKFSQLLPNDDDDDVYLQHYSGKGFDINYSVYMSYVKHIRHK
jgi:hypothetical protein